MPTSSTKLNAIFGFLVSHSKSPLLHSWFYKQLNLADKYTFLAFQIPPENLQKSLESVKVLGINGLAITIPHKIEVIQYLDEISPTAQTIGAINTVTNRNGILTGENTDWLGALLPLWQKFGTAKPEILEQILPQNISDLFDNLGENSQQNFTRAFSQTEPTDETQWRSEIASTNLNPDTDIEVFSTNQNLGISRLESQIDLKNLISNLPNPEQIPQFLTGQKVALLGSGGAASGILYAVLRVGAEVTILNRTKEKAETLQQDFKSKGFDKIKVADFTDSSSILQANIIINSTSVGLNSNETPFDAKLINPDQIIFDSVYNSNGTSLILEAQKAGASTISGLEMLFWQAVYQLKVHLDL
jgi:shikimate 5-dehydrogenase